MNRNQPVVSTAKIRGLIKKNKINYVDATRKHYPSIATGIHVWQFGSHVLFQVFDYGDQEKMQNILNQFIEVLGKEGFSVETTHNGSYEVVEAVS